jgi:hypothetical protein
MNISMKCVIAALAIACVCLTVGVVIGWKLRKTEDQKSAIRGQGAVRFPAGVFPAAGGTNMAFRPARSTNQMKRAPTSSPARPSSTPANPQVQNAPEVKQAQEALVAAHKRAADVMEKAMKENHGGISFDAFHNVQNLPEVKQARAAIAEADLKYNAALRKAMGQTGASNQLPVKGK